MYIEQFEKKKNGLLHNITKTKIYFQTTIFFLVAV
jgi:hypothetical protein